MIRDDVQKRRWGQKTFLSGKCGQGIFTNQKIFPSKLFKGSLGFTPDIFDKDTYENQGEILDKKETF